MPALVMAAAQQQAAVPPELGSATYWYDARDLTATTQQTLPNRAGSGTAQLGSVGTSDTNDPLALPGSGYVYLPGTASNNLGIARAGGWAATMHITATLVDNTTATFTSSADPIPIGNTSLAAGRYKRFDIRDTDGSGTLRVTIDLTTETLGQTSWTCTTGQTVTVNRATSGITTAIVTRPVLICDSSNDYIQFSAGETPTFTATTGAYTVMAITRIHNMAGVGVAGLVWSSESASLNGLRIQQDQANASYAVAVGGATTSTIVSGATLTASQAHAVAAVVNNGNLKAYTTASGLIGNGNTTGVGTITHTTPKAFTIAYTVSGVRSKELFAVVTWNQALSSVQLGAVGTYLLGTYS